MDSKEPQSPPPPPHLSQTSLHLQPVVVLVGPNPFVNSTVPTTMMTPITARFPLFNTNINPLHSESFNNDASMTAPSTTVEPCMKTVVEGSSSAFVSASSANKRKRGRPRKHVPPQANADHHSGSGEAQGDPAPAPAALANPAPAPHSSTAIKTRGRGRPRGSSKKRDVEVHGQAESRCFAHVIYVNPGENIMEKLPSAFRGGRDSGLCVLTVNGSVSTVSLHQSGSIATYEGHFRLISLSCNFKFFESRKGLKRIIDWRVCLVGSDSRLIGGLVADKLIAASPVTVIMSSFTLVDANASMNDWEKSEPSAPSSQFSASGTPASANVQEPAASDQSTGENNENIPLSTQGPVYNNDTQQ